MARSPQVVIKEIDSSLYVRNSASSIAGFVGLADKGPIGDPQLVTNWAQYVEVFGGYRSDSWLAYAVKAFFDNGGGICYVVRTAHYTDAADPSTLTAVKATIAVQDTGALADALIFTATSAGTWANGIQITHATNADNSLDITVLDANGNELESFEDVLVGTANVGDENYIESRINEISAYVDVADQGVVPAAAGGTVVLASGDDGLTSLADTDYIGSEAGGTGMWALAQVENLRLLSIPGITANAVQVAMVSFCEGLNTCFAVLATPEGLTPAQAVEFRTATGTYSGGSAINSSFAALYWPWVKFYDSRTRTEDFMPPEGIVLGKYAHNDNVANYWDAPAGLNRGVVRNVLGVGYASNESERDVLYSAQVNPIANFQTDGIVVWGQKTLQAKPSAMDRVNVRRLLIQVQDDMKKTAKYLLFEPNEERTWEQFKRMSNPYFRFIQDNGGLYNFLVKCDDTTNTPYYRDRNIMKALIYLQPTKTAEVLEIPFVVTPTGASFEDFQA